MFLRNTMTKKIASTGIILLAGLNLLAQDAVPANTVSSGSNLLATLLIITAFVLAFVIYGMGQVLIAVSRQLLNKSKTVSAIAAVSVMMILSLCSQPVMAQDALNPETVKVLPNYGGLSAITFYLLVSVIATEMIAILFLFFSIRRIYAELLPQKIAVVVKQSNLAALWVKLDKKLFTKAIPIEQEADALLDHNYDGIQELDNALPPWWKYGFILTIGFAIVYLLNFHVFGIGQNPTQEYAAEMSNAKAAKEEYEANNKDKIDELNVPMANALGITHGKEFFTANCVACHGQLGEGGAGPNLTDEYWLHNGSLNDVYNTIKKGYPDKGMQSWAIKFNPKEISELASYIKSLKGTNPPNAKAPQGDLFKDDLGEGAIDNKTGNPITLK
ncbi:MAG: cbb3-type cytochrome c oxidase N-terminal domain-containing protein [Ferruginibacter sp.]